MYLFKNTKNNLTRAGKNLVVYGLAGVALTMLLTPLLPEVLAGYVYILTMIGSMGFLLGCLLCVVGFFRGMATIFTQEKHSLIRSHPGDKALPLFSLNEGGTLCHRFSLTDQRVVLVEETYHGTVYPPRTLSFKKLNQAIAACDNPLAKRYQGIDKKNCFRLAAQVLYRPEQAAYTPGTAEELFYHQQQALAASDLVFATPSTRFAQLPDYAKPYDTFVQQAKRRFTLEEVRVLESHTIAYHEAEDAYYEVYDRTIGQCGQSHLSGWVRLFDPDRQQPLRRLSKQEVRDLLHRHRYTTILYYNGSYGGCESIKIALRFRTDGTIALADEYRYGRDGGGSEKELDAAFFADKSTDEFISFLTHKYKLNFEDLYNSQSPLRHLLPIIKETRKPVTE